MLYCKGLQVASSFSSYSENLLSALFYFRAADELLAFSSFRDITEFNFHVYARQHIHVRVHHHTNMVNCMFHAKKLPKHITFLCFYMFREDYKYNILGIVDFSLEMLCGPDGELPEKLRNLEPRLIEHVSNEIMDRDPNVRWEDIAGLEHAKKCVTEMVIWPLLRPDIFQGCRSQEEGTGKTMIGKAIAGEAKATFFYISASSLTSKWIGEGEKLVRALFGVASCRQPAVIFYCQFFSLQRKSEGEHESSRRLKTQFLIEMEGFDSGNEQILLIGATNRPQELDEAARRRLTKRLYIPLPSSGYSGSDMKNLVKDASMGPLREALGRGIDITKLQKEDMRPDFEKALQEVRPSVSVNELGTYEQWNNQFGSLAI
ncbi:unnamed protein product [Spirodela intermedia]|uniref:Uncharacterized protein n=1 Tax=Spirodela intermedia TaxID=51605 RepID=A0A7I8J3Y1_SPIIN|nr:unnamed protein product [Spirodela intermedia]CAA6664060.1 unnamed protein product [Spirodela intermedia]